MGQKKQHHVQTTDQSSKDFVGSSAAEYLTFIATGGSSESSIEMRYEDEKSG